MKAIDLIVLAVVAVIVSLVLYYIHREKKNGVKCIGCPNGTKCAGNCGGCHHEV